MSKINPSYVQQKSLQELRDSFSGDLPAITLHSFLEEKSFTSLQQAVCRSSFTKEHIANKYSYGVAPLPKKVLSFLHSEEFLQFISPVIGKEVDQISTGACYRFGWKNYTLLHDELLLDKGIDIILDFTPEWVESWGGLITYTEPGHESMPLLSLPNSLFIVQRSDEIQRFIQYVNHFAEKKQRFFVLVTVD